MNMMPDFKKIRTAAENYYRDGDFYCSEAIVKTIRDELELPVADDIIAAASGFPVGMGAAGCSCGAVAGGVMALGMVFGRTRAKDDRVNKAMALARELHDMFKSRHGSICCRSLTKGMTLGSAEHMDQCVSFTGEVAEAVARIIVREYAQ